MSNTVVFLLHAMVVALLFFAGKYLSQAKNKKIVGFVDKIKIGELKNISPRYTLNYIGCWIQWSGIIYFLIATTGLLDISVYIVSAITTMTALVFHISAATGCSPSEAFDKINLNKNTFTGNVFVRFSVVFSATMIVTGLFICYVLKPLFLG